MKKFQFQNKIILILSQQNWGINQLSKHLYAKELSKNNKVYFIHTIPNKQQSKNVVIKNIEENLYLISINIGVLGVTKLPSFLIDIQTNRIIQKILKELNILKPDVVWSFEQSRFQNLNQFRASISIFHPVDYILKARPFLNKIANSANIVLSVSEAILDEIDTSTPKYFINHGVDEIFLTQHKSPTPPDFISQHKVNVGYVGNLQMKLIDWDNLIQTVEKNPELNFIFIGPDKKSNIGGVTKQPKITHLKSLPNTHFTGSLNKKQLAKLLPFIEIFWLCYDNKKFPIEVSNSHKILEYLSTGKVIISNFISTYKNSSVLEMANSNNELSSKLKEIALNLSNYNNTKLQKERINFAKENTYKKQIERIENIITSLS